VAPVPVPLNPTPGRYHLLLTDPSGGDIGGYLAFKQARAGSVRKHLGLATEKSHALVLTAHTETGTMIPGEEGLHRTKFLLKV
jgi:hypothetical protein